MAISKEFFGKTKSGEEIYKYFISNSKGMKAGVINFGAILVNLYVPDRNGVMADVVLGYDDLEAYFLNGNFFGATIGPNANRIAGACFRLGKESYQLDANNGENNLHSHADLGYHKRVWNAAEAEDSIIFTLEDTDGSMGFPGNKKISVTYTVTEKNELKIHYHGTSDKDTIINMTNHSYFNLAGHDSGDICEHRLQMSASLYTPILEGLIPTGEIASVEGTPFDFRKEKRIGDEIYVENKQLELAGGYDHNWVLDGDMGILREFATVREVSSGRVMKAFTDLPGVQFYAGNFIDFQTGKGNVTYDKRSGLCLETQYYPDTANKPQFPSAIYGPDREYDAVTVYQFMTE